jgi:protease-4
MKNFLQSLGGALAAILLLAVIGGGIAGWRANKLPDVETGSWLVIDLHGEMLEYDPPGGVMSELASGDTETLQRMLDSFAKVAVDDRIAGVVLRLSSNSSIGTAAIQELRGAIAELHASGKKVYAYAESFDTNDYYLLAACDEIIAPATAYIEFKGASITTVHIRQALEKIGIKPNLHRIKDYKSAAELLIRDDMSEQSRENRTWMMNEAWEVFMTDVAADRQLTEPALVALMERAVLRAAEALEGGLIDRVAYWDEVEKQLQEEPDGELLTISHGDYAKIPAAELGLAGDKTIAVVHVQGTIVGRESGVNPLLGLTMGHETVIRQLRRAREDDDVAAIIIRIDSGGGDALGSDLMGHEVEVSAASKPVIASMVDVAASGGYHIAYRASRILANSLTVTGSIGSISTKFNVAGLFEKLGITQDAVSRGPMARWNSFLRDFTPAERARFEEDHWAGFDHWLRDVSEHRGMSVADTEKLAHGRVWTGRQAFANGLIDEIGGLSAAIDAAKRLAEIPEDESVTVVHYPEKRSLIATLLSGDHAVAISARWLVHRMIRDDVANTLTLLQVHPAASGELRLQ